MKSLLLKTVILSSCISLPSMACDDPACMAKLHKNADGKVVKMDHAAHAGHGGYDSHATKPIDAATQALDKAMAEMHTAMMVPYTGDADRDFLRGMIPHHQGAVDMAKIVLQYGQDAQVKRLARDVIRAQEYEIKLMQRWLKQLDEKAEGPGSDEKWLGGK